jgi:hypothetical protein
MFAYHGGGNVSVKRSVSVHAHNEDSINLWQLRDI